MNEHKLDAPKNLVSTNFAMTKKAAGGCMEKQSCGLWTAETWGGTALFAARAWQLRRSRSSPCSRRAIMATKIEPAVHSLPKTCVSQEERLTWACEQMWTHFLNRIQRRSVLFEAAAMLQPGMVKREAQLTPARLFSDPGR
ncbi:Hypothetical predicted protein [Pelobates cultripes]|uniref:Uncharacterized protein n=1 Tax=Pelobates cultripes TaxID=61616 RepID=A0AAD1S6S4_PELCU|nr:Hypothetical predicted protein [Pelobates cultripes]